MLEVSVRRSVSILHPVRAMHMSCSQLQDLGSVNREIRDHLLRRVWGAWSDNTRTTESSGASDEGGCGHVIGFAIT